MQNEGAEYLARVLQTTVNRILCASLINICTFSHSKSLNSISHTMKSETKEHTILPMLYGKITRWTVFYSHLSDNHLLSLTQALTILDLGGNQIGDEGAQYLADALKTNEVKCILSTHSCHYHLYFFAQKLTILNLSRNEIGDEGAKQFAGALQNNKVNCILSSSIS